MPGGCPFASEVCSKLCYAKVGQFPLNAARYQSNYDATMDVGFADRASREIQELALRNASRRISVCAHEKGEFYSLQYLRQWGRVIREARSLSNLSFFIYTRSWISPAFRKELDSIAAECRNAQINLSTDHAMNEKWGVPKRVGDGMVVHLAETDNEVLPAGIDLVLRNLRVPKHTPTERLGGVMVCPNESGLYISKVDGMPVIKSGKTIRIRCQDCCRLCIDRGFDQWEKVKNNYLGTPGFPSPL